MAYKIVARTRMGEEVVDETDSREDAEYLLGEYMLVYQGHGTVRIEEE